MGKLHLCVNINEFVRRQVKGSGKTYAERLSFEQISHHAQEQLAKGNYKHKNHPCRKPNGGMFLLAKRLFKIDLQKSWMVGDKINDLIAANSKNLKKGFLVLTGYGKEEKKKINLLPKNFFTVKILSSLKNLKITF